MMTPDYQDIVILENGFSEFSLKPFHFRWLLYIFALLEEGVSGQIGFPSRQPNQLLLYQIPSSL